LRKFIDLLILDLLGIEKSKNGLIK
jgi:hypothetical protein